LTFQNFDNKIVILATFAKHVKDDTLWSIYLSFEK